MRKLQWCIFNDSDEGNSSKVLTKENVLKLLNNGLSDLIKLIIWWSNVSNILSRS
jgi:hypothetical protein